jgi:hypothetical protein
VRYLGFARTHCHQASTRVATQCTHVLTPTGTTLSRARGWVAAASAQVCLTRWNTCSDGGQHCGSEADYTTTLETPVSWRATPGNWQYAVCDALWRCVGRIRPAAHHPCMAAQQDAAQRDLSSRTHAHPCTSDATHSACARAMHSRAHDSCRATACAVRCHVLGQYTPPE